MTTGHTGRHRAQTTAATRRPLRHHTSHHTTVKLDKNNCSPTKRNHYVLQPRDGDRQSSQSDGISEVALRNNPGFDSRYIVTSEDTAVPSCIIHNPYGERVCRSNDRDAWTSKLKACLWAEQHRLHVDQEGCCDSSRETCRREHDLSESRSSRQGDSERCALGDVSSMFLSGRKREIDGGECRPRRRQKHHRDRYRDIVDVPSDSTLFNMGDTVFTEETADIQVVSVCSKRDTGVQTNHCPVLSISVQNIECVSYPAPEQRDHDACGNTRNELTDQQHQSGITCDKQTQRPRCLTVSKSESVQAISQTYCSGDNDKMPLSQTGKDRHYNNVACSQKGKYFKGGGMPPVEQSDENAHVLPPGCDLNREKRSPPLQYDSSETSRNGIDDDSRSTVTYTLGTSPPTTFLNPSTNAHVSAKRAVLSESGLKVEPDILTLVDTQNVGASHPETADSVSVPATQDKPDLCVQRPNWQNADVAELDRRVARALRLRQGHWIRFLRRCEGELEILTLRNRRER